MHDDLKKAVSILNRGDFVLVAVKKGKVVLKSDQTGIRSLVEALSDNKRVIDRAYVADKVVGKAAAFLLVRGNISALFTPVISSGAAGVLKKFGIPCDFDKKVDYISNKRGNGPCPMEKMCTDINDPEEAFRVLSQKISTITIKETI